MPQLKITVSDRAFARLREIAEVKELTESKILALTAEVLAHVHPEAFFTALGSLEKNFPNADSGQPPRRVRVRAHVRTVPREN